MGLSWESSRFLTVFEIENCGETGGSREIVVLFCIIDFLLQQSRIYQRHSLAATHCNSWHQTFILLVKRSSYWISIEHVSRHLLRFTTFVSPFCSFNDLLVICLCYAHLTANAQQSISFPKMLLIILITSFCSFAKSHRISHFSFHCHGIFKIHVSFLFSTPVLFSLRDRFG